MKKYLLLLIFCLPVSISFGQIFSIINADGGITILPDGIKGITHSTSEVTNVSLGTYTLSNITTGTKNVGVGYYSLHKTTTGSQLTAIGHQALSLNTTGMLNSAFGRGALGYNTTGNENTAVGGSSMTYNTSLSRNVAVGIAALREQTYDGDNNSDNIAVGSSALMNNNPTDASNGRQNIGVGDEALYKNLTGSRNIGLGEWAAHEMQTGNDNIAVGYRALWSNVTGSKNTVVGFFALGKNVGTGNVAIGSSLGDNELGDNKLYIAHGSDEDTPLIGGDFAAKKLGINRNLSVSGGPNDFNTRTETLQVEGDAFKTVGNGNWLFPSDRRLKKNILALNRQEMLQKVLQMQGVTYEMKDESQKGRQYGFIAQDLREIFPSKIVENKAGYLSADYGSYDPMITESIKALNQKLVDLKKNKADLELTMNSLNVDITTLLTKVEQIEATKAKSDISKSITDK
ncbi:tail fiber domain-containing protein [Emticicia agri]|uniref:Tail fiber domain-containing protein n=1 Tax=Emticicia agri TaxID=2492393 RepID=A0A4Q5M2H2_9BACT|nr:tail fiber domain-containing protein [Emticicia agri]RYU96017.1 tail fiber domain-containing protein [Emticicia agri]